MITLDQEQKYTECVKKFDTFRGGTESNLFNLSTIIFQVSNNKTMETIMFGAQSAKRYQRDGQKYQDDIKDNSKSEANIMRKTQKSVKFQIEEDKVIEASGSVTRTFWQQQKNLLIRVRQSQEQKLQDCNVPEYANFIGGVDNNFQYAAEMQRSQDDKIRNGKHSTNSV
jgi:hypothetical protein